MCHLFHEDAFYGKHVVFKAWGVSGVLSPDSTKVIRLLTTSVPSLLGRKQAYIYMSLWRDSLCVTFLDSLVLICERKDLCATNRAQKNIGCILEILLEMPDICDVSLMCAAPSRHSVPDFLRWGTVKTWVHKNITWMTLSLLSKEYTTQKWIMFRTVFLF